MGYINIAATMWVPVTAELPPNAEHVLIANTIWADAHDAIRCEGKWMNLSMQCEHLDSDGEVTHWCRKPLNPNTKPTERGES